MKFLLLIALMGLSACASNHHQTKTLVPKTNGNSCASGNANICFKQGAKYWSSIGVNADRAKAKTYFEKACALDHPQGCMIAGYANDINEDYARARKYFGKACAHNVDKGCANLGQTIITDDDPKNDPEGVALLKARCKEKDARACYFLGNFHREGVYLKTDRNLAHTYLQRACDLKDAAACFDIAKHYKETLGSVKAQYQMYEKSCTLGERDACAVQYVWQIYGTGTQKDARLGVQNLIGMCKKNHFSSCADVSYFIANGIGIEKNVHLARRLLELTCERNYARSCTYLGAWYDHEEHGTRFNAQKALAYYKKGCELDHDLGCIGLGYMYKEGRGVPKDLPKAFKLFESRCKTGFSHGCIGQAYMHQKGEGTKQDTKRAYELFTKQCTNQMAEACVEQARARLKGLGTKQDINAGKKQLAKLCKANQVNACLYHGRLLLQDGDKPGAIAVLERQCNHSAHYQRLDACLELIKLGQEKHRKKTRQLLQSDCRRLVTSACETLKSFDLKTPAAKN